MAGHPTQNKNKTPDSEARAPTGWFSQGIRLPANQNARPKAKNLR